MHTLPAQADPGQAADAPAPVPVAAPAPAAGIAASGAAMAVLAAALALPGVLPGSLGSARAEEAPERGLVSAKLLSYQDRQPGLTRIKVTSPSLYVLAPLGSRWSVEGTLVGDQVSGASPRYHTAVSGASRMHDDRHAVDLRATRYFERSALSLGTALSTEHDYKARSLSAEYRWSSDDNNRTWNVGLGLNSDRISSTNAPSLREKRRGTELQFGVTQALSRADLLQATLTAVRGRGFYNDPYKLPDIRPDTRNQTIAMLRWNHHFDGWDSTLRTSYRWYGDNWKIRSHTLQAEWVQTLSPVLTLTPLLRVYTQSAAKFYFDPVYDTDVGAPYPPGFFTNPPAYASADQRLSAFGAVSYGAKLAAQLNADWSVDLKYEHYEQRGSWRIGGAGSTGLEPFSADMVQLGVSRRF